MPIIGNAEKGELERLIHERLVEHYDRHGPASLLDPGLKIVVDTSGPSISAREGPHALAAVEIRSLFTVVCLLAADAPPTLPREELATLANEAARTTAAQINRLSRE